MNMRYIFVDLNKTRQKSEALEMKIADLRIYYNKYHGEMPLCKFDRIDQNILITDIKLTKLNSQISYSNFLQNKYAYYHLRY